MPYNPQKHHRRSIRLRGYDYTRSGVYFVTICAHDHVCLFGQVRDGRMHMNEYGRIVLSRWYALRRHFSRLRLDAFVVMPNHVHGILILDDSRRWGEASENPSPAVLSDDIPDSRNDGDLSGDGRRWGEASENPPPAVLSDDIPDSRNEGDLSGDASPLRGRPIGTASGSVGAIVQNFKSTAARAINRRRKTPGGKVWQRNYYERTLCDERALRAVRRYIEMNPTRWEEDRNNRRNR